MNRPNRTCRVTRDGYFCQVRLPGTEKVAIFRNAVTTTIGVLLLLLLWPTPPVVAQQQSPFQIRVTGSCTAGSSIRIVNAHGSVVCEVDNSGAGTVTSVGSGSGLTGGPITTAGTISIATEGVTSAHILDGTIGSVDVDSSQVQRRVLIGCAEGSSIRSINDDGSVVCQVDTGAGVTAVTASAPLGSSGETTPNISLPHVIIDTSTTFNTAIGSSALPGNTGLLNTAIGRSALFLNTTGINNTASGMIALFSNTEGSHNTASGFSALASNTTGSFNTAIGAGADVSANNLDNATAIGAGAVVNVSNKIRLGDANVTVIEGQVAYTFSSDKTQKENFQPVDGEEVLRKLRGFNLTSWNYIGHDPKQFRHYGPVAQEFFAAFGHDGIGTAGSPTTINSGDLAGILMSAVQELAKQNLELKARLDSLEQLVKSDHVGRVLDVVEK